MNIDPSLLKKYLYEYALIFQLTAIAYLFFSYERLNKYIREKMSSDSATQQVTIKENTEALKRIENFLITIKQSN